MPTKERKLVWKSSDGSASNQGGRQDVTRKTFGDDDSDEELGIRATVAMEALYHLHPPTNVTNAQDVPDQADAGDDSDSRPSLIPLRIPAALLSSLSNDSRLVINQRTEVGVAEAKDGDEKRCTATAAVDALSLTVTQGKQSGDIYTLEADPHSKQHTDWYESTSGTASASTNNDLHHIGTTANQYTIQPKSKADSKLKEIGKRTRRLLEEERKKRKGIVRLDENEFLPETPVAQKPPPPPETEKKMPVKKNTGSKASTNARKRKRRVASNVDGWMPNVEDILSSKNATTNTKDDHSNIVRLHGLPIGVKPENIAKVFHGLNPSLIFILPSFINHIQGWDATYDAPDEGSIVNRHPSNFRVFVKFTSAPVANAAIERSGESIGGFDTTKGILTRGKREIVGASISMSPVPKNVASFIQKHMAIRTRKGESIIDTLNKTEQQLGTSTHMIWRMTMKSLNLQHCIIGECDKVKNAHCLDHLRHKQHTAIPTDKMQYEKLAKLYNRLIDMHETLELNSSVLFTHAFDPTCMEDSVHRITQSVSNWLLDEIYVVGRVLKESRQWIMNL